MTQCVRALAHRDLVAHVQRGLLAGVATAAVEAALLVAGEAAESVEVLAVILVAAKQREVRVKHRGSAAQPQQEAPAHGLGPHHGALAVVGVAPPPAWEAVVISGSEGWPYVGPHQGEVGAGVGACNGNEARINSCKVSNVPTAVPVQGTAIRNTEKIIIDFQKRFKLNFKNKHFCRISTFDHASHLQRARYGAAC